MKRIKSVFVSILFFVLIFLAFGNTFAQKLIVEEIIAKHLQSIGTDDVRKKLKNQLATGLVQYTVLRKNTGGSGRIVFASESDKLLFGMTFSIPSYKAETFVHDGKKTKVAFAINNARSELGDYVYRYDDIIEEGLFGGTLSTGWALKDLSSRNAKVDLSGTKKVNDREAYVLEYSPKGGSDLKINIYIDKENFQHLRTEYKRTISSIIGSSPDTSSQQREQRQNMIEDFADYKKENNVNMPHSYRIYLMLEGASGTREYEYKANMSDFFINQPIDPNSFNIESK